jgi:hypothetical protein
MRAGATGGGGDARGRVRREFGEAVLGRLLPSFPAVAGVQVGLVFTSADPCSHQRLHPQSMMMGTKPLWRRNGTKR